MAKANVFLPPYKKVMDYEKTLDVGEISPIHDARNSCLCKGFSTNFHSTLQKVCDTVPLFRMFSFIPTDKQLELFQYLKSKSPATFGNLQNNRRTIIVRTTGRCPKYLKLFIIGGYQSYVQGFLPCRGDSKTWPPIFERLAPSSKSKRVPKSQILSFSCKAHSSESGLTSISLNGPKI